MLGSDAVDDRTVPFDNRLSFSKGRRHLTFELGGKRIRYAYIRKNGCSAFKAAMGYEGCRLGDIPRSFKSRRLGYHDATIFVWRWPEERLISLYRNKILDGKDNDDLIRRYREHMGEEPTTFEAFVEFAAKQADHHCYSQKSHLKGWRYTHAIPLRGLHAAMVSIVGEDAAAPFARPVNPSQPKPVEVTPRARQMLKDIYADDYALIARLRSNAGIERAAS